MNKYCYKSSNPKNKKIDIDKIKKFTENLYRNPKISKHYFKLDDPLPFVIIYTPEEQEVCISMKSKSKTNLEKIEHIHSKLNQTNLIFDKDIILNTPYLFKADKCNWWDDKCNVKKGDIKWTSLSHRGPYFTHIMEPYKSLDSVLIYDGVKYKLTPKEEEIAGFYAKRIISEQSGNVIELLTKDSVFNKNFWTDFKKYLTTEHTIKFKDFTKINFTDLVNKIIKTKETEKETAKQDKTKKIKMEEKKHSYGFAYVDGNREAVANFTVEPASIFYGRGKNPLRGKIKKAINPEDVIINIGKNDIPPSAPTGYSWNSIVHDQKTIWLAKWTDTITKQIKYVWLSAEGKFKGQSDFAKYEKAKKLNDEIDNIRKSYMKDAQSSTIKKSQLGTVMYLIDIHGLRVGNEESKTLKVKKDEGKTVGASTLKVGNIKLEKDNHIIFDFIGKDSIRYYKDLEVPEVIYKNLKKFVQNSKDNLFNSITSKDINDYLKTFDPDFSAKVFRTRLATEAMKNALDEVGPVPYGSTKTQQKAIFRKANAKVAEILNHQRTVSKKAEERIKKLQEELKVLEKDRKQMKKDRENLDKIDKKIAVKKSNIEASNDTLSVAINTSLTNYIDPRLVIEWIRKNNVDIGSVYTATLQKKFEWALHMNDDNEPSFIFGQVKWKSVSKFIKKIKKISDFDEDSLSLLGNFALYSQNPSLKNPLDTPILKKVDKCIKTFKNKNLELESKF